MNPLGKKILVAGGAVTLVSAGLMTMIGKHEGRRYEVYLDPIGIPTVCDGQTGPHLIKGKVYTDDECDAMKSGALAEAGTKVLNCTKTTRWKQHEYEAITSLAYNVGAGAVCTSCLPGSYCLGDLLRDNLMPQACERMKAFTKVRINGKLVSCYDKQFNCYGLVVRRQAEYEHCMGITQ